MKIRFLPTGQEIEGDPNKTLLQLCQAHQIAIASICKGIPSCAECRVKITEGEHNMMPPSKSELNLIGSSYYLDGRRLSCQVRCFGDITVDITEQVERAKTQKKKTRGFQWAGSKNADSKAIQGTLVLEQTKSKKTKS